MRVWRNRQTHGTLMLASANAELEQKLQRVPKEKSLEQKSAKTAKALTERRANFFGQTQDNRIENLHYLCPNCHALTETYRGRNKALKNECREHTLTT